MCFVSSPSDRRRSWERAKRSRARTYDLRDVRFTRDAPPADTFETSAVLRYRGTPLAAAVDVNSDGARLRLAAPALVAPGQAVVFYQGDEVVGGGVVRAGSPA